MKCVISAVKTKIKAQNSQRLVLRKLFGPKRSEVTGGWRELHNEQLYDLYSSPHIIRVIRWRIMRWAGHMACIARGEVHTRFRWGNLMENVHFE